LGCDRPDRVPLSTQIGDDDLSTTLENRAVSTLEE
jgi:hypothetical protein